MEPTVIYEDNHLLAINKPAGWLVQGDKTGDRTLTDWGKAYLKEKYDKPGAVYLHPVHRIDRPVSGAVLFARTDKALGRLTEMFRTREVKKKYVAIVEQAPYLEQATLKHFLIKDEAKNRVTAYDTPKPNAKESILEYSIWKKTAKGIFLNIDPITGRPHQIRVQLAKIGCIIVGDLKYGATAPLPDARIALHCRSMELLHPVQKVPIIVVAEWPDVFLKSPPVP
jgi:23S rRNA pseudouridine1911/1915/1917 synthase